MGSPCTLLILAAGMGSRYGGLKQLDPVGPDGSTLMDYSVFDAARAGFTRAVFVIREEMQAAFERTVAQKYREQLPIDYAFQQLDDLPPSVRAALLSKRGELPARQKPWGTGHAILAARKVIREPFTVINADDYYGPHAFKLIFTYLSDIDPKAVPMQAAMVGYQLGDTLSPHGQVSRGLCQVSENGLLESIQEVTGLEQAGGLGRYSDGSCNWKSISLSTVVSMNFWGFPPEIFSPLAEGMAAFVKAAGNPERDEFYAPAAVQSLVYKGLLTVKVLTAADRWFGVTYLEDRESVARSIGEKIRLGVYPEVLWPES